MNPKTISAILRTSKDFSDKLRQNVSEFGFNLTEFSILEALFQKGELSVGTLLSKVLVNNSTVSYTLSKLVKDGLIKSRQDANDKRIHYVTLSLKGNDIMKDIAPKHYAYIESIDPHLNAEEESTLRNLLKKLNKGE